MAIGDDKELFNAVMSDEPVAEPQPAPEPEVKAEETPEPQPRDELGQFAAKPETPEEQPAPQEPPAEPEPRREDHRIPLAEHLSVRERAQNAERERDGERQRNQDLERRLQAMERQLSEARQPKPETPDVWADPEGYVRSQIATVGQGQEAALERMSRAFAVDKYGAEAVNAAMAELEQQMQADPNARFEHQRIMASDHPYGELVNWHRRQSAFKEIGDDPAAYKQRVIEEALKDPEVIKRVVESARAQAQQPPANGQSRSPLVDLPPSLNRTTGNGGQAPAPAARTDAEMFKEMFPQ